MTEMFDFDLLDEHFGTFDEVECVAEVQIQHEEKEKHAEEEAKGKVVDAARLTPPKEAYNTGMTVRVQPAQIVIPPSKEKEKCMAEDGTWYTYEEFLEFYGDREGKAAWGIAKRAKERVAANAENRTKVKRLVDDYELQVNLRSQENGPHSKEAKQRSEHAARLTAHKEALNNGSNPLLHSGAKVQSKQLDKEPEVPTQINRDSETERALRLAAAEKRLNQFKQENKSMDEYRKERCKKPASNAESPLKVDVEHLSLVAPATPSAGSTLLEVDPPLAPANPLAQLKTPISGNQKEVCSFDLPPSRHMLMCASPDCRFLVHERAELGAFCCIACSELNGKDHGPRCQRKPAPANAIRADPKLPRLSGAKLAEVEMEQAVLLSIVESTKPSAVAEVEEDDEDLQEAMKLSMQTKPSAVAEVGEDEEDLQEAMALSMQPAANVMNKDQELLDQAIKLSLQPASQLHVDAANEKEESLMPAQQEPSENGTSAEDRPRPEVGQYFETLCRIKMRAQESLYSTFIGYVPPQRLLVVLEVASSKNSRRIRVCEERGVKGWVSITFENGGQLLTRKTETAADKELFERLKSITSTVGAQDSDLKCDKCDGPHATDCCPFFKKARENHEDAWDNYGRLHEMGSDGGNFVVRHAQEVKQPGDGNCLYHSLIYGLPGSTAPQLRVEIATFVETNSHLKIGGNTIEKWVQLEHNTTAEAYARRMKISGWGGGLELACFTRMKHVNVHVYEKSGADYKRIACFDYPCATQTLHLLYHGRVHYEALVIQQI